MAISPEGIGHDQLVGARASLSRMRSFACGRSDARLLYLGVEMRKYVSGARLDRNPPTCLSSTYSRKFRFTNHLRRHPMKIGMWLAIGIGVGAAIGAATHQLAIGVGLGAAFGLAVGSFASRKRQ